MNSTSVFQAQPVALAHRRKPLHTYRSPSAADRGPTIMKQLSGLAQNHASTSSSASTSSTLPTTNIVVRTELVARKKYPMTPPLPLYHPFGRLALSLPPLDPAQFGHSVTAISVDDSDGGRRSSARSRRPAAKVRDAEEGEAPAPRAPISNVSAIAAVAAREIKEKASPRRKRGGGAGAKRKRRDVEDGDASYPAKRTRNARGTAVTQEDGSPSESGVALPEVTPTPEPGEETKAGPERRATRSSGGLKRRDSSASIGTSRSVSGAREAGKADGDAKEEGEVSDS